jgi:hypothetical protein
MLGPLFFAAQKLIAFDRRDHANGSFIARFGSLYAPKAANTHRPGQRNFVWQRQENLYGGPFFYVFLQEEIYPAGADVAGFCTCLTDGRTCGPTNGERKAHGKALGGAAF